MHFSKNRFFCSSACPKIIAFGSHFSATFQLILDCFILNFKLKYKDSENVKADCVNTVVFNLHQIKRRAFFIGHSLGTFKVTILARFQSLLLHNWGLKL